MSEQSIEQVKIIKLFKELEWIRSDLFYHKKLVEDADTKFMKNVDTILDSNPELKQLYKKKEKEFFIQNENNTRELDLDEYINESISDDSDIETLDNKQEIEEEDITNIKKLYRQIVKITHPDKIKSKSLNSLYIDATNYYNTNDNLGLYLIAIKLNLDISKQDIKMETIEELIKSEKNKIEFIRSTYSWLWFNSDDKEREKIVLSFIKNKIS